MAKAGETNVPLPASLNLGDVIERVHHAIAADTDAALPRTRARTYTAGFDGEGLRFSPHRPAWTMNCVTSARPRSKAVLRFALQDASRPPDFP